MNNLLENSIIEIITKYNKFFFNKKNVIGIALGVKNIKKINTNEPCLQILVEKKLPLNKLCINHKIPKSFLGITVDVIETGKFSNFSSVSDKSNILISNIQSRIRPIEGGLSVSPYKGGKTGTLGCIVFDNQSNKPYILSNSHILSNYGKYKKGAFILQPGIKDSEVDNSNLIARLSKFSFIKPNSTVGTHINYTDCAIAELIHFVQFNNTIKEIGNINGITKPLISMSVKKVGRTTGFSTGRITNTNAVIHVDSDIGTITYSDQIIATGMSESGDSGSLVLNYFNKAIGLLMAGNGMIHNNPNSITIINPIEKVLNLLDVYIKY